jgi:hypothetical protein
MWRVWKDRSGGTILAIQQDVRNRVSCGIIRRDCLRDARGGACGFRGGFRDKEVDSGTKRWIQEQTGGFRNQEVELRTEGVNSGTA